MLNSRYCKVFVLFCNDGIARMFRVLFKKGLIWVSVMAVVFMPCFVEAVPNPLVERIPELGDGDKVFF